MRTTTGGIETLLHSVKILPEKCPRPHPAAELTGRTNVKTFLLGFEYYELAGSSKQHDQLSGIPVWRCDKNVRAEMESLNSILIHAE